MLTTSAVVPCKVAARSQPGCLVSLKPASARTSVRTQAKKRKLDGQGFVVEDNSGKANIFPTSSKPFVSSPRAAAVSSSGIGGVQGAGVVAAALALVVVATVGVVGSTGGDVSGAGDYDSLTLIASRIQASL